MRLQTTAVVVTYNRCEMLEKCIDSLLRQSVQCDILIVDNHSTDRTRETVAAFDDPRITYYDTGKNLGGAGGFYIGVKLAASRGYGYLWLMDDDTIPAVNALEKLFSAAGKLSSSWAWLSSKVLWSDNTICKMNVQRSTLTSPLRSWDADIIPTQVASFVSLLIDVRAVRKCGLPVKDFFIWGDDWEYTRRLSRKYPCFTVTSSTVTHLMADNLPNNIANAAAGRVDRFFYAYRNEWYTFRREFPLGWLYYSAKCTLNFWKIIFTAPDSKLRRISVLLKGVCHALVFFPAIEFMPDPPEKGILQ